MQDRLITFAGSTLAIEYDGARAAAVVDFLLADATAYVHQRRNGDAGHWTIRLLDQDGMLLVSEGPSPACLQSAGAQSTEYILGRICHQLANWSTAGLIFHAAAVARGSCGVLLPGAIGAGKTTLTAWLAAQGWNYLSDELVCVPLGSTTGQAFTRPLSLRPQGLDALRSIGFAAKAVLLAQERPGAGDNILLPASMLGNGQPQSCAALAAIVFPHFVAGAQLICARLSAATAGLALMECLINARNLPQHGFGEIARLARALPAYSLTYGDFAQLETCLDGWEVE